MVGKTASVDIEPIDRLEEKIKQLVGVLERQRADQARLAEENLQLRHELEAVRAHASDVAYTGRSYAIWNRNCGRSARAVCAEAARNAN